MRRLAACLVIPLLLVVAPSAHAQQGSDVVALRLVHQTPWIDPLHTSLDLAVRAVNGTDHALDDLSLGITIETPTGSRSEYEQSLQADTGEVVSGTAPPLSGSLAPGAKRVFRVPPVDLSLLAVRGDTAIYPMKVELRSNDLPVATMRSPVVFLAMNPPDHPLDLTWTFVLSAPILFEPSGAFRTPWLQRQVAHGGLLRAEARALAKLASRADPPSLDVVVSPQLVDQLIRMRRGYTLRTATGTIRVPPGHGGAAAAGAVLRDLRTLAAAPSVELSALPYASPSIPALIRAGLAADLPQQLSRGKDEVGVALAHDPVTGLLHPPGSHLDQASLFDLHQNAIRLLLVDDGAVHFTQQQPLGFAEPPAASLSVGTPTPLTAVVPDHGVESILDSSLPDDDPHLAAQVVLGELAAIWLERPSVPRGVAMIMSERTRVPGYFFGPFAHAVDAAPWLRPMKASALVAVHPPSDRPAELVANRGPAFSPSYLSDLVAARDKISTYRSILTQRSVLPSDLDRLVLLSEAGQFASQEYLGESFLASVGNELDRQLRQVTPDTSSTVTLSSRAGLVPVSILNASGHPVKVRIVLRSNRLTFAHGNSRVVEVPGNGITLNFGVQARTTGRFPIVVSVLTPDGQTQLSQGRLVVRSTAYNRIALVLTLGAALFLLALWARRFLPWTKR